VALTLEAEQRMRDAKVIEFYEQDEAGWLATVRDARAFLKAKFPAGSVIRRDDVAKALLPILEVHEAFNDLRNEKKLRPKYWVRFFADLLIDRSWDAIVAEDQNGQD
jgi:hypothetical protein